MPTTSHWQALLVCAALILLTPAAAASPVQAAGGSAVPAADGSAVPAAGRSAVPPDVAAWFGHEAPDVVVTTLREMVVADPAEAPERYTHVTVGEPRPLYAWSEQFRSGTATDKAVTPIEEWVAPYVGDGEPAGSIVAWREDGSVTLAVFDDDAALSTALAELPPRGVVVTEPVLGAHFGLLDGTVTTLSPGLLGEIPQELPLEEFRPVLVSALGELVLPVEPEPGARPWLRVTFGVAAVAAAVAVALPLRWAWRRAAPGDG